MEPKISTIADSMREGKLSDLEPGTNRIILGRLLASQLEVGVGDTVTVMTPGSGEAGGTKDELVPILREFTVAGIFEAGLQEDDSVARAHQSRGRGDATRSRRSDRHSTQVR
jgi:lipoprotein-releasing system permease protein